MCRYGVLGPLEDKILKLDLQIDPELFFEHVS